jgi:pimeloyl-ACP methyl ester carboxylesterase
LPVNVVLVHGAMGSKEYWTEVAAALEEDFNVVTYDLRNHGSATPQAPATLADHVDDLRRVVTACESPPLIAGISLGAFITLRLTSAAPDLARVQVLV